MRWLVSSPYRISVMHGRGLFTIHHVYFGQIVHVYSSEIFLAELYACFKNIGIESVKLILALGTSGCGCVPVDDWGFAYCTLQH